MFYCQACAKKKSWPESLCQSQGPCEVCGKTALCNDVPSKDLPPSERSKALGELATVCGAMAFSLVPDPAVAFRFNAAKNQCRDAGMTAREISQAIDSFRSIAQEAIQKTLS